MTNNERAFASQSDAFLEKLLRQRGYSSLAEVQDITDRTTFPVYPVVTNDLRQLTSEEKERMVRAYRTFGVAYFIWMNPRPSDGPHPIFLLAAQLQDEINLRFPLVHPLEGHPESVKRFGDADATVKIYDLPKAETSSYREVAETNLAFEVHSDGLGSGNAVENFVLYSDSAPVFGGFTFFYDLLALALSLARTDYKAFQSLFWPTAITAIRPRGKGAIKVISPILYLDDDGNPNAFFRRDSGEYTMKWRQGSEEFDRGLNFLMKFTNPFCNGSCFVNFTRAGHGIVARNLGFAHGRTPFIDGNNAEQRRVLSRKWFMKNQTHQTYKHVPGMLVDAEYSRLFPEYFGADKLVGEWRYDIETDTNIRIV